VRRASFPGFFKEFFDFPGEHGKTGLDDTPDNII
jgi:hypothetical protein